MAQGGPTLEMDLAGWAAAPSALEGKLGCASLFCAAIILSYHTKILCVCNCLYSTTGRADDFSLDGQQDNSDSSGNDFYLKLSSLTTHIGRMNVAKF